MQTDTRIESAPQVLPVTVQHDHEHIGWTVQPIEQCIRIGQEAWTRLNNCQSWNDWLLVGAAHVVGRTEAMRSAHCNAATGRRYNQEFGDWLKSNKFDGIDKKTRSDLFECVEHRNEIEAWRATLATNERIRLNHPTAVLRRWRKIAAKKPDEAAPKKPSHVEQLKTALIESQEEAAKFKREAERLTPFTREDTARNIAGVVFRTVSPSKAREIARELNRLVRAVEVAP